MSEAPIGEREGNRVACRMKLGGIGLQSIFSVIPVYGQTQMREGPKIWMKPFAFTCEDGMAVFDYYVTFCSS